MAEFQFSPPRENRAFGVPPAAGDAIEQFLLTLALKSRDAQDLAGIELERDVVQQRTTTQPTYFQSWLRVAWDAMARDGRRDSGGHCGRIGAQHERDDAILASMRALCHADGHAIAQHRRPVA